MSKSSINLRNVLSVRGFSLIEMAMVLLILGTLLSGLLVAVGNTTENTRRTATRDQLQNIAEALYGFAQATGRLPCPATSTSGGYESPGGGGNCTSWHGFVPAASLGIQGATNNDGLLVDAWNNPLRYTVDNSNTFSGRAFTSSNGLSDYFSNNTISGDTLLRVCDSNSCTGDIKSSTSPAVVVSMGSNWATYTSSNELENAGEGGAAIGGYEIANDSDFVDTEYNEASYDDMIYWLSPHVLFSKMISAGQLP